MTKTCANIFRSAFRIQAIMFAAMGYFFMLLYLHMSMFCKDF